MKNIIEALRRNGVDTWRVTKNTTLSAELYFIKKELDIPRFTAMTETRVEVFHDFTEGEKKFRGSTAITVSPGTSDKELDEKIRNAYYAASFIKNPFYELPEPTVSPLVESKADFREMPLKEAVEKLADALLSVESDENAFINSAELFVRREDTAIRDSRGTDVRFTGDSVWGEFVAQCLSPVDVEQYRQFSYDNLDIEAMKKALSEGIRDVRLRASAKSAPKSGKYNVILTGENVREILNFYKDRTASAMIFARYSPYKVGDCIQGETDGGEALNISLRSAKPFSAEGIPLKERPLLENGVLKTVHGGARFAYYLGIEPTGDYEKLALFAGTMAYEDMKKDALEAVSFSDFQMDIMDGHFAGEMRLALLGDPEGRQTAKTGGSINGSILETQGKLIFSKEQYRDSTYEGPFAVLIPGVTVSGE